MTAPAVTLDRPVTLSPSHAPARTPAPSGVPVARWSARPTWLRSEVVVVLCVMLVGLVAHGLNMFNFPAFSFLGDEGIYSQQAWAVLREGRLTPYTYFYDHAPAGWILLAGWMGVTGGPETFGSAIASGRVFMLLLHVACLPLLYRVVRKLGVSVPVAATATLLFSLSPLALLYQRLVLLDNIALFWVLLSLDLLLDGWGRLTRVALSGALFGLALLSKETAIILLPAAIFVLLQQRWTHQGRFAIGVWLVPLLMVISWYPLYAWLKGELLPSSDSALYALSDAVAAPTGHVSLLAAAFWQLSRTGGGPFNLQNDFWRLVTSDWLPRDALLVLGGTASTAINLVRGLRNRRALAASLFGLLPIVYFARGGVVFSYYVLFALPFLCLNVALVLQALANLLRPARLVAPAAVLLVFGIAGGYWLWSSPLPLYTQQLSAADKAAVVWIKQNLPSNSFIVVDDSVWADLHESGLGGPAFPNVASQWKVTADPAIRDDVFHGDWQSVDYVVMTPGEDQTTFVPSNNTVTLQALQHAHIVQQWSADGQSVIQLWKVDKAGETESQLLAQVHTSISTRFEQQGAYVSGQGQVTSESESYALLRAAWLNDRPAFDRAWTWMQTNMIGSNGLPSWLWQDGAVVDLHSAADADSDTALALLLGGQQWHDAALLGAGQTMVQAIWTHDVVSVVGQPYLTAGDWARPGNASLVTLNPSYFAPYAYHVFAAVDPDHNWSGVVDTSYGVLFASSSALLGAGQSAGLPPDWVGLTSDGTLVPVDLGRGDTTSYGYDAARTYWRVALDAEWWHDGRAQTFLNNAGFLRDQVQTQGFVNALYAHDGTPQTSATSTVGDAGALAALQALDPSSAASLEAGQLLGGASRSSSQVAWGDPDDLYTQEWGWFGTALYAHALPNLWVAP